MRPTIATAIGTLALLIAAPASADIVFATGNLGGGLSGVNLPQAAADDGTDFLLEGTVNPDGTSVFITGNENIDSAASGLARVIASDGSTLNFLNFALESGFGADTFVFNLRTRTTGTATVTGFDQFGNSYTSSALTLNRGQNFINLTTLGNQLITRVSFDSTPLTDVRQIRFGDIQPIGVVPEPASWAMMILGFGASGALLRRRRQLRPVAFV